MEAVVKLQLFFRTPMETHVKPLLVFAFSYGSRCKTNVLFLLIPNGKHIKTDALLFMPVGTNVKPTLFFTYSYGLHCATIFFIYPCGLHSETHVFFSYTYGLHYKTSPFSIILMAMTGPVL